MRTSLVLTIFKKEITETLRDRRTLLLMIGLPILLYPLMVIAMSRLQESQSQATRERKSVVAVWGELPADLGAALSEHARMTLKPWEGAPAAVRRGLEEHRLRPARSRDDGQRPESDGRHGGRAGRAVDEGTLEDENPVLAASRELVMARRADAVLVAWPELTAAMTGDRRGPITIYFDSIREDSRAARTRLADALADYRKTVLEHRERDRGLPRGFTEAVEILPRNVAPAGRRSGYILGTLLPFFLVSLSLLAGFYPAIDLTAGEKERGTMQTLMCAPVRPSEIIFGKFLAVSAVALVAAGANVASLAATVARIVPGQTLRFDPGTYALALGMLVPVTLITSALFLAVAAFAKDFKDGQNFLTPVYVALAMPAAITMVPGIELDPWTAFVPVVNIALLVKALLIGEARGDLIFLTLISSAMYATLAVLLAVRVFQREQVLLGGRDSVRSFLGLERRFGGAPTPAVALATFATALVIAFYVSLATDRQGIAISLLVIEVSFLAPTLAVVRGLGYSARETLSLRVPSAVALAGSVLIGISAWAGIGGLVTRIATPPDSFVRAMERLIMLGDTPAPLWLVWFVIGITPAICEEALFRGLVLSGLRRLGAVPAIVITALLFGLAHASIYRLLPSFTLGLLLTYVVWRTGSIVTGVIIHALTNGIIATMVQSEAFAAFVGGNARELSWTWTWVGVALTVAGLFVVARGASRAVYSHSR